MQVVRLIQLLVVLELAMHKQVYQMHKLEQSMGLIAM